MKRIFYTSILAVCMIALMSFADRKQDPVSVIVEEIAKHNVYEYGKIGFTGLKSKQFDRFLSLIEIASDSQLLQLTQHANVVVRIYAFQACTKRGIEIPKEILLKFKRDNSMVKTINGCEALIVSVQKLTVGEPKVNTSDSSTFIIKGGPGDNR